MTNIVCDDIETGKKILKSAIENLLAQNYKAAIEKIEKADKIFKSNNSIENVSVCMSLLALLNVITNQESTHDA